MTADEQQIRAEEVDELNRVRETEVSIARHKLYVAVHAMGLQLKTADGQNAFYDMALDALAELDSWGVL